MTDFKPGERLLVDRVIPATFVGYSAERAAIIQIGVDTRVVDPVVLARWEG